MEWMQIVADRQIKEAMDAGEFDNLPGKGKPLNLDEDLSIPAHQRMAMKILRNAQALPDWIQTEKDIERERTAVAPLCEKGLEKLRRAKNEDIAGRIAVRLRIEVRERMDLVNTLILKYNQIAPNGYQKIYVPFALKRELEALDSRIEAVRARR